MFNYHFLEEMFWVHLGLLMDLICWIKYILSFTNTWSVWFMVLWPGYIEISLCMCYVRIEYSLISHCLQKHIHITFHHLKTQHLHVIIKLLKYLFNCLFCSWGGTKIAIELGEVFQQHILEKNCYLLQI
jgi:hypothetical protein